MQKRLEQFKNLVYAMLDAHRYDEAKQVVSLELQKQKTEGSKDYIFIGEIAGFLVDIGAESMDAEAAETGAYILEKNAAVFQKIMTEESFYYNLGNAKETLYKVRKYGMGSSFCSAH